VAYPIGVGILLTDLLQHGGQHILYIAAGRSARQGFLRFFAVALIG
jgi:hypothetical protein